MMNGLKLFLLGWVAFPLVLSAAPTTSEQAMRVVENWRNQMTNPLDSGLSSKIAGVKSYYNEADELIFHVVSMEPTGFVVVAGDDQLEPIVAIVSEGIYDELSNKAMQDFITQDLSARVDFVKSRTQKSTAGLSKNALSETEQLIQSSQKKWSSLSEKSLGILTKGKTSIADVRVAPLITTKWAQRKEGGGALCFNLYTPNNYLAGCTATAFAQLLKYFSWDAPLPSRMYSYSVENVWMSGQLMGGDGNRGPYDWDLMSNGPYVSSQDSRNAIGRLLRDAGIAVRMKYRSNASGGRMDMASSSMVDTFGFSQSMHAASLNIIHEYRNNIVIPNLDAGLPLIMANGGHAFNCDGYGFDSGTLYSHLNWGSMGAGDAWYALPVIMSSSRISDLVYNVFTQGTGEIISGRVIDSNGAPLSQVQVTAHRVGGGTYTATTNVKGIYALKAVPSNSSYQISAQKNNLNFVTHTVQVAESVSGGTVVGNRWGINFQGTSGTPVNSPPIAMAGADAGAVPGNSIELSGTSVDSDGMVVSYQWFDGTTQLSSSQTFSYAVVTEGARVITLRVTDNEGAIGEDTLIVTGTVNQPPVANAKEDRTVEKGTRIIVYGSGKDSDGSIIYTSCGWYFGNTLIDGGGPALNITPSVAGIQVLTLKVVDNNGACGYDTMTLTVTDSSSGNSFPTTQAGADQNTQVNASITINGSASDSDGTIRSYKWSEGSTVLATTASFTYTPTSAGTKILSFIVTDNDGAFGSDSMRVFVAAGTNPPNQDPIAIAGSDQATVVNQSITITGGGTDSDGTIIAYQWSEGSTVLATTASFSYTPTSAGTKTLTLTVTDNDSATDSDTMAVVVSSPGDTDADGLLDTWEITHFGSITAQNGSGDPDSDGVSNEREETLGSDPNNAATPGAEYANLCGWWKFDETTGTVAADSSGNGSDADNVNGVLVNQSGQLNGAFGFDGSNDSSATQGTAAPGNNLTITAWIRPSRLSGNQSIIAKNSSFTLKLNGSAICFTTPGHLDHHGSSEFVTDVWQFVAVTFTPSATGGCRFYRNGTFQNAINSSVMNQNSNPIVFGKNQWGQYFKGGLDDIHLYDRILTAAEIDALYQNTAPNTAPSVQDATFAMAEDAAVGATVGTVAASDPENDTLAFSMSASDFAIDPVSGEITVTGALDYETTPSYSLTVTVSDGALSDTATITIDITDVTDEDADGLDDAWEMTHFGNRAQNASGDPDGDGYSNLEEAICGTHPNDSSSCWLLENGEGNLPSFYGATGRKYTIRYSTNLVSQTWLPLVSDLSGTNGIMQVKNYDTTTNGFRAYRVEVEME